MRIKGQLSISKDNRGDSFWRTKATNGNVLAGSTDGYRNLTEMRQSLVTSTAIQLVALTDDERSQVLAYLDEVVDEGGNGDG